MLVIIVYLQNMGTSQSRGRQEQYIQVNHPRFSNSKIVSINSVKVLETQINTQEKSYERWRSSISSHNIDPKKYRFLLLPLRDSNVDKCAVCTNRRNVTATYDNYPLLLTDAIDFLRNKHSTFSEPELWHLLYAICAAEEEISSINGHETKLGDVRPQNVFLSEKGKIKLANQYSWPGEFNSYEKLLDGQSSYLAPEDMEDLRNGIKRPDLGTNESTELFAVGLTMLSAGNLKENGDLYDTHKMLFDKPEFLRRINFWLTRQRYSETLRILVAYLCNLRPYKRWSFSELWRWLSKHRAKIGAHEFSGNEVELPQLFKQENEELKLNAPLLAELPETYTNQYYKQYEPRNVLSDKTAKENEAEQELKAINLRKSNVSNKSKNHRQFVSPNKNTVLEKGKAEKKDQEVKKDSGEKKNSEEENKSPEETNNIKEKKSPEQEHDTKKQKDSEDKKNSEEEKKSLKETNNMKQKKNLEIEKKKAEEKKDLQVKNNPEPKSIQTSRVGDAKIRELIELVEQQRLAKLPEKSAVDPVFFTADPKEKKESPSKKEEKSFVLEGTTSQVKPVQIENGNINIPFISNNPPKNPSLQKDLTYSYPYHPQFYNPHVRYVSPSRKIEPAPPNKQPIYFTYSQVGSQAKPKEDNKNPKKSIVGSNAGSQVSNQKVIIQHKVQKINSPKKGLNDAATVKKEQVQGKNEINKSNKSGNSEKQALNTDKNHVSTDQKGQSPSNNKVHPAYPIQVVQSQVVQKQETLIDRKKPVEETTSNQNEKKPTQDPKTPIKKEIAETNSSRLRKSGSSGKSQALKKSDELGKSEKGVDNSKKIIVSTNNKITTKKSIQKFAGETGIKKEQEPNTKGKDTQKSIKSIKQPSVPGIEVDINNPSSKSDANDDKTKDPTSLKVIKERPAALIGTVHDKAKSPVSSPVLSPKSKLPISSSPKGASNKLAVSAVVPTDNSASKQTNKLVMSTVSRKEGQHIYLKPDIQMPKKNAKTGGVTKIQSIKQIQPKSIIKKSGQEKEAKVFVNKEDGNKSKLIGDKKPIFEVNNKSLLQSKVAITSRVQPSLIHEEPAQLEIEKKEQGKEIHQIQNNNEKNKSKEVQSINEKDFENHGIFSLETLINKKPEEKQFEIIQEPTYQKQFTPKGKIIDEDLILLPHAEVTVPHAEVPKAHIELPHAEVPKANIELPHAEVSVPHAEVPKANIELPHAEVSVSHAEVPKAPHSEVSIPHAQFPTINTSSHHVPQISSAQVNRQIQLPAVPKPFIPFNQPEISPILIVDETSYPSELQHIISPKNQKTINSNIAASSQSLPNVVQPFDQYPSPINKKKKTINSQQDVDQQYLQYFEHQEPKVVQPQKKPAVNVLTPAKKDVSIIPQPSSPNKIAEESKENKSTEKRSLSNPASQKKFKINEEVLKYDIVPQQQKKESPPKSQRSIKQISPTPSAKALSEKKSTISQANLDIKYAQVVPVDNKSFNLSIVQYQNKQKSKIQSKVEEKPKSTISRVSQKPKSNVEEKKSIASKVDQKPKSRILTREEEKKPITKIEDKPKSKIQPKVEEKPKSTVSKMEDKPKPINYKVEDKPKSTVLKVNDKPKSIVSNEEDKPKIEEKPRSTVSRVVEDRSKSIIAKVEEKPKSTVSKVEEKPKSKIQPKVQEKQRQTFFKTDEKPKSKNEQRIEEKKSTISKVEDKPKSRIVPKEEEKKPILTKVETPKSKIQVKAQQKKPIISKFEQKPKSKIQAKVQEKKSTISKVQERPKSRIQSKVEEKKSTLNLIDLQRKSIRSENKVEAGSKIIEKPQPSKLNELVPQTTQKAKTRSERIFDKKEIAPPVQVEIPEPSQKSSIVKVLPKGSNLVEKKKSEIDIKKIEVSPAKISQRRLQIKPDDAKSQARSRLSAISQQKSDRSHLSRKSRKRIDFQHEGHIDFKFISTAQLDKKSVSGRDIKFIKNPTESGGNDNHIEAELIHLRRLGSDGKSVHSFRDRKNIHFKHDADDEAKYSIRDEEGKHKNIVVVNDKERNMTPNKLITKDRTKSEKFIGLRPEIQSQKTIRYPHNDAPVINIIERWKLEKIQENSKVSQKKEVSKEGTKKQESKISFDKNQSGLSKPAKEKSDIEVISKKSQTSQVKKPVPVPKEIVEATSKPVITQKVPKNEPKPTPVASTAKPSSSMDMIDDLLGFNRQPIRRQRNQDVKAAPEKEIHSPAKVETQRKDIKSAPKQVGADKSKKVAEINKETSIIKEIKEDNGSKVEGDTKSQMRSNRFQTRTPQRSQVQRHEFKRKSRKHIDFQHDGHIDFKFIEKVKIDGKASSILQNQVKFIKNPSQSAGDSNHIEAEIIHLRNLGTDGKSIRSYRDIKDVKFKHDADNQVQYSIKGGQHSHIRNLVTVGQNYLTPNKDTFKERTKTQVFNVKDNPASQTVRVERKTERFTSQKSGLASKLLSSVEPVLEIESPVKEKQSEHKSSNITPVPIESKKQITRTTPNRLQSRPGYNNDLIDDLLGFGKPKRQEESQPKPEPVVEQKSTFADKFIEEVKETNRIIRDQKNKRN